MSAEGQDPDPQETDDWLESLEATVERSGKQRGRYLLHRLQVRAGELGLGSGPVSASAYENTIPLDEQAVHPGDVQLEERITAMVRWNALAMVVKANRAYGELGGHIASFASAAEIFETGFNHFFRGPDAEQGGDLVYFQPHSAPGVYARAYLEGRLEQAHLEGYRQEVQGRGLSSYPHPWLMPDFWQFPTGSMGIGPISSIYQARFLRYLQHRGLAQCASRHVWGVFGDGEMDEPESVAALTLAARERLDNLTFIINCNLQRLDGPVRGNGQIIQELESLFRGAGWNVIKVMWASEWDELFARDTQHALRRAMAATPDGAYQSLGANDASYNREHFFDRDPAVRKLIEHMTSAQIEGLRRGGHDFRKLYAAFAGAKAHPDQPTVILAKTKKGFGMGRAGESRNTAHQEKKLDEQALLGFRDRFDLPLSDAQVRALSFYRPGEESAEISYLRACRQRLGGYLPRRGPAGDAPVAVPKIDSYASFCLQSADKVMSTTMALVRMLTNLLRDTQLGRRIVPIVADEARTFGMASLFRQVGIYSPAGQLYQSEDAGSLLAYREARDGQMLEEGITEAGAMASWTAAATAYSVHGLKLLPFYIYYSMFGFQRVGDLIWAAADQRARGFLIGATAGRTTLGGEGLQHQDGSSQLIAATIPTCRAYDPAHAGELAVILDYGARAILERNEECFYYITVMNESYPQPSFPPEMAAGVIKGMYCLSAPDPDREPAVRLLGSGAILREVLEAAALLAAEWQQEAQVWSVTSFSELARDARDTQRWNRLHPTDSQRKSYVASMLAGPVPIIAATDYVAAYPGLIAGFVEAPFLALGTDGFGRSDTRPSLRRFFEVDRWHIAVAALNALACEGRLEGSVVDEAFKRYRISPDTPAPWTM